MANTNGNNGVKMTPEMWAHIQVEGQALLDRMFGDLFKLTDEVIKEREKEAKKQAGLIPACFFFYFYYHKYI